MSQMEQCRAARIVLALLAGVLFYFAWGLTPWWPGRVAGARSFAGSSLSC